MTDLSTKASIGVVIPHYNRASLLKITLDSLDRQTMRNWLAVVVDDGSDPEEWRRIEGFASDKVQIIRREDGVKGPSRCRNLGWKLLQTPYIIFLDSDDLLAPWSLEERLKFAVQQPNADAWVFPVMLFREQPGDLDVLWNQMDGNEDLLRFLRSDPPWHTSSPLWRSSALWKAGGFNEQVMYGDDADLHIRALLAECRFAKGATFLPDAFVRRANQDRITNTLSDRLLDSRIERLRQLTPLLRSKGTEIQKCTWQGQYFVECEFLLFRTENPSERIDRLLNAWRIDWDGEQSGRTISRLYFNTAQYFRKRLYLILRIARRIAKILLPRDFFPKGGTFENTKLDQEQLISLKRKLQTQVHSCSGGSLA
jgi:glycosyltransferase involved in cell wall biosynthesis